MSDFAGEQYKKARKAGIKAFREAGGKGRYPYLTSLDEILLHTKTAGTEDLGVCEIPLSRVTGTKTASRSESFAWNFMPLLREKTEFSGKWERLYEAQMEEGIREPVKVYEYMHHFYVREGNKRVSVMKYVGAVKITADVTRIFPKRDGKRASEALTGPQDCSSCCFRSRMLTRSWPPGLRRLWQSGGKRTKLRNFGLPLGDSAAALRKRRERTA